MNNEQFERSFSLSNKNWRQPAKTKMAERSLDRRPTHQLWVCQISSLPIFFTCTQKLVEVL